MSEKKGYSFMRGASQGDNAAALKALKESGLDGQLRDMIEERMAKAMEEARAKLQINYNPPPAADKGLKPSLGRHLQYMAQAGNRPHEAKDLAHRSGDRAMAELYEKAWGQDTIAAGGALMPAPMVEELMESLQAAAVLMSLGVTRLPMQGSLVLPYVDTAASAYYVAEAANATESTPTTGQVQLNEKTLVALAAISNQLLNNASPLAEQSIKQELVRSAASKMDSSLIRSAGASGEPKGLLYWCPSANKFNANGTVNVANVTKDLGKATYLVANGNVPTFNPGWVFAPRTEYYLKTARDSNNNLVWAPEMNQSGTLMGFPYRVTTNIPITITSNYSEVYFGQMGHIVLGESEAMELEVFPNGSYYNGSSVVSGISTYQSVCRLVMRHDLGARARGKELSVIEQVTWGV